MRFGVSGELIPDNMDAITPALTERVRALGFSGVFSRFRANDPHTTTREQCLRARAVLEDAGLAMYQATGYWQCLIHPDEAQRGEAVRTLQAALRVASWLGARGIDTGPGSMSPRGPWFPHPDNWAPWAREQLVKSLKECAPVAEGCGVILSLEGHQLVTLDTAETMRAVLDEVDSPMVKCDFDPVNWITLRTVFETGPAVAAMVETLGPQIVSAHAKDVAIQDRLVVHIDNIAAGTGILDYPTFLRLIEDLDPSYPVIVEAAAIEELPAVSAFLHRTARECGIAVY
ncbi:MAG: sugar phosphate isomerase/epimerase [Thermomicrobiales bacterium]